MQDIIVEKPYTFVKPVRTTFWPWVFKTIGLPSYILARYEKVTSHELRGVEHLQASLRAGHGVLLAESFTYGRSGGDGLDCRGSPMSCVWHGELAFVSIGPSRLGAEIDGRVQCES